jgi:hypothetical protein
MAKRAGGEAAGFFVATGGRAVWGKKVVVVSELGKQGYAG